MVSETRKLVEFDGVQNGVKEFKEIDEYDSGINGVDVIDGISLLKVVGEDLDVDEKNKENEDEVGENNCLEIKDKGKEYSFEIFIVKFNGYREEEIKENNLREQLCEVFRFLDRVFLVVINFIQDIIVGKQGRKRIKLVRVYGFLIFLLCLLEYVVDIIDEILIIYWIVVELQFFS